MGAIRQILPNYTTEDYERWEGRWVIINGIAIAMSPMPPPKHQFIAGKLHRFFDQAIEYAGCVDCKVYQPIDYKISENIIVNPDLLIVCQPIEGQFLTFAPALVVEILSPSTALMDKNTKYDLYQAEGVLYYIIVDPTDETVETYILDDHGLYKAVTTDTFLLDGCEIKVDLGKCFQ
jgi:Uma2 family endonuclease